MRDLKLLKHNLQSIYASHSAGHNMGFNASQLKACIKYQRLIDFQALFRQHDQGQLFETVARLNNEQSLYFEHRKVLRSLVALINENCKSKKIKASFFHKVLNDIVGLIPRERNRFYNVKRELARAGCEIFIVRVSEAELKIYKELFDVDIDGLPETICDFR